MAIIVQKRPYEYCFSGNPVSYEIYSDAAAADSTIYFEMRLQFRNVGGDYTATDAIPYYPVNGVATIDVQDLLEGLLEYELPTFNADEKTITAATRHTGNFYLQFREITSINPDPSWDDSENEFSRFVIKGGLSRMKYQGNNFFVNYFFPNKPFLTWQQRGRKAALTERMYLLYLHTADFDILTAVATVYYTDGTQTSVQQSFPAVAIGACYYVPAGAGQWELTELDPTKNIYYWEITVIGNILTNATALSEAFRYEVDNRNNYNDVTLHYRSSLGSLDSVRIRGVIEQDEDYEYTEQSQTQTPDYFDGHFFTPQKRLTNAKEIVSWKGEIGHLKKEEQDRLRDTHLQRETWWEVEKKWWPINITTKNRKQKTSNDTRFTFPIEWTLAQDADPYYTPQSISLGAGVFTSNVCLAFISDVVITIADTPYPNQKKATVQLNENDPQAASTQFRYRVLGDFGQLGWFTQDYGTFDVLVDDNALMTLELQPICTNNVYGRKTTATIDTRPVDSGGTTGGSTQPANSYVRNNTANGSGFSVKINNVVVATGYVAGYSSSGFYVDPGNNATVEVTVNDFSPSSIQLYITAPPDNPDYFDGHTATFYNKTYPDFTAIIN